MTPKQKEDLQKELRGILKHDDDCFGAVTNVNEFLEKHENVHGLGSVIMAEMSDFGQELMECDLHDGNYTRLFQFNLILHDLSRSDRLFPVVPLLIESKLGDFLVDMFNLSYHAIINIPKASRVLDDVVDIIAKFADHDTETHSAMMDLFVVRLIKATLDRNLPWTSRLLVLKTVNILSEKATAESLLMLRSGIEFEFNLLLLAENIYSVGDYEIQVCTLEALYRLGVDNTREEFARQWLKHPLMYKAFMNIRQENFETDAREFLNVVNMNSKTGVISLPCRSVHLGRYEVKKPPDDNYKEFWVDFNVDSRRISLFCGQEPEEGQSQEELLWDTIAINTDAVSGFTTVVHQSSPEKVGKYADEEYMLLTIVLKHPSRRLITFGPQLNDLTVMIIFDKQHDISSLLKEMQFGKPSQLFLNGQVQRPESQFSQLCELSQLVNTCKKASVPVCYMQSIGTRIPASSAPAPVLYAPAPVPLSQHQKENQLSQISQTDDTHVKKASIPISVGQALAQKAVHNSNVVQLVPEMDTIVPDSQGNKIQTSQTIKGRKKVSESIPMAERRQTRSRQPRKIEPVKTKPSIKTVVKPEQKAWLSSHPVHHPASDPRTPMMPALVLNNGKRVKTPLQIVTGSACTPDDNKEARRLARKCSVAEERVLNWIVSDREPRRKEAQKPSPSLVELIRPSPMMNVTADIHAPLQMVELIPPVDRTEPDDETLECLKVMIEEREKKNRLYTRPVINKVSNTPALIAVTEEHDVKDQSQISGNVVEQNADNCKRTDTVREKDPEQTDIPVGVIKPCGNHSNTDKLIAVEEEEEEEEQPEAEQEQEQDTNQDELADFYHINNTIPTSSKTLPPHKSPPINKHNGEENNEVEENPEAMNIKNCQDLKSPYDISTDVNTTESSDVSDRPSSLTRGRKRSSKRRETISSDKELKAIDKSHLKERSKRNGRNKEELLKNSSDLSKDTCQTVFATAKTGRIPQSENSEDQFQKPTAKRSSRSRSACRNRQIVSDCEPGRKSKDNSVMPTKCRSDSEVGNTKYVRIEKGGKWKKKSADSNQSNPAKNTDSNQSKPAKNTDSNQSKPAKNTDSNQSIGEELSNMTVNIPVKIYKFFKSKSSQFDSVNSQSDSSQFNFEDLVIPSTQPFNQEIQQPSSSSGESEHNNKIKAPTTNKAVPDDKSEYCNGSNTERSLRRKNKESNKKLKAPVVELENHKTAAISIKDSSTTLVGDIQETVKGQNYISPIIATDMLEKPSKSQLSHTSDKRPSVMSEIREPENLLKSHLSKTNEKSPLSVKSETSHVSDSQIRKRVGESRLSTGFGGCLLKGNKPSQAVKPTMKPRTQQSKGNQKAGGAFLQYTSFSKSRRHAYEPLLSSSQNSQDENAEKSVDSRFDYISPMKENNICQTRKLLACRKRKSDEHLPVDVHNTSVVVNTTTGEFDFDDNDNDNEDSMEKILLSKRLHLKNKNLKLITAKVKSNPTSVAPSKGKLDPKPSNASKRKIKTVSTEERPVEHTDVYNDADTKTARIAKSKTKVKQTEVVKEVTVIENEGKKSKQTKPRTKSKTRNNTDPNELVMLTINDSMVPKLKVGQESDDYNVTSLIKPRGRSSKNKVVYKETSDNEDDDDFQMLVNDRREPDPEPEIKAEPDLLNPLCRPSSSSNACKFKLYNPDGQDLLEDEQSPSEVVTSSKKKRRVEMISPGSDATGVRSILDAKINRSNSKSRKEKSKDTDDTEDIVKPNNSTAGLDTMFNLKEFTPPERCLYADHPKRRRHVFTDNTTGTSDGRSEVSWIKTDNKRRPLKPKRQYDHHKDSPKKKKRRQVLTPKKRDVFDMIFSDGEENTSGSKRRPHHKKTYSGKLRSPRTRYTLLSNDSDAPKRRNKSMNDLVRLSPKTQAKMQELNDLSIEILRCESDLDRTVPVENASLGRDSTSSIVIPSDSGDENETVNSAPFIETYTTNASSGKTPSAKNAKRTRAPKTPQIVDVDNGSDYLNLLSDETEALLFANCNDAHISPVKTPKTPAYRTTRDEIGWSPTTGSELLNIDVDEPELSTRLDDIVTSQLDTDLMTSQQDSIPPPIPIASGPSSTVRGRKTHQPQSSYMAPVSQINEFSIPVDQRMKIQQQHSRKQRREPSMERLIEIDYATSDLTSTQVDDFQKSDDGDDEEDEDEKSEDKSSIVSQVLNKKYSAGKVTKATSSGSSKCTASQGDSQQSSYQPRKLTFTPKSSASQTRYLQDDEESKEELSEEEFIPQTSFNPDPNMSAQRMMDFFGREFTKKMETQKRRLEKRSRTYLKQTQTRIAQCWDKENQIRNDFVNKFSDVMGAEISRLDSEIGDSKETEQEIFDFLKSQQEKLEKQRNNQLEKMDLLKSFHRKFNKRYSQIQVIQAHQQPPLIAGIIRKELGTMQKSILADMQKQELGNMKRSLHRMMFN